MRRFALLLGVVSFYLAGSAFAQNCAGFDDVLASDPFCPDVTWLKTYGITKGCDPTHFCPTQSVSRLQMAAFVHRLGNLTGGIFVGPKAMTLDTFGLAALASWPVTGTDATSGSIDYTIIATDGGSQMVTEKGTLTYLATQNSITCTVLASPMLLLGTGTVNSGCTPGFFNPGAQPGVTLFDNVSFTSPAAVVVHYVYFEVHSVGGVPTRLEP